MKLKRVQLSIAALLCVALISCAHPGAPGTPGAPQPLSLASLLEIAQSAAEALVSIIGQPAGLSPEQITNLQAYTHAFGEAVRVTAVEATSADTAIQKAVAIGDAWKKASMDPNVIAALPQGVRTYVEIARAAASVVLVAVQSIFEPPAAARRPGIATPKMPIGDPVKIKALGARGEALAK